MSDGANATPGLPDFGRPASSADDNQWLTRSPRPSPGAAPWERGSGVDPDDAEPAGNHTDGVTVADLIAKVHGHASVPEELKRPRPEPPQEPDPPPPSPPTEIIEPVWDPVYANPGIDDTEVFPAVSATGAELPDLARLRRADRVGPSRVGTR